MMRSTTDGLVHAIDQLHAIENSIRYALLEKIVEYEQTGAWRDEDGSPSIIDWVAFRQRCSRRFAAELVQTASAVVGRLPAIAEGFRSGLICWEKLALLATVATPDNEALWAEEAVWNNYACIEDWVRAARRIDRRDAERKHNKRYLRKYCDEHGGVLELHGRIPGADGAVVAKAIDRLVEQAPPDHDDGTYEPHESRCADALVQMASAHIAADADADRATVVVHVDARELNKVHGTASVEDGPLISSEVGRRLACDSRVQLVVENGDGEPIGVGRITQSIPPAVKREMKRRDKGCRFGDCGRTRGVHGHHIQHFAHGGRTDLDNLILLCPYHHRLVHEGGWRVVKDSQGQIRFVRPDGRPLNVKPVPLRPDVRERLFGQPCARPRNGPGRQRE